MALFCLTKRELVAQLLSFVLGLASSAFPTYTAIITSTVVVLYLLIVIALPNVHPRALLIETRTQITDTRIWLDDEATTRRSSRMYVITAQGRDRLERCVMISRRLVLINGQPGATRKVPPTPTRKELQDAKSLPIRSCPSQARDQRTQMSVGYHHTEVRP